MSGQFCWILLTAAAVGQAEPPASVHLDAQALGLDAVVDETELQFEDRAAYFQILAHLQRVDPQALSRAAAQLRHQRWSTVKNLGEFTEEEFPVFVDLFLHPDAYRGQPVTLRGHIVGPIFVFSDENEYGLDPLYQAHLFDSESQSNPATVIFTDLPDGLDLDAGMIDGVSVTGYFLKKHIYRSRDRKTQIAPLILARTITVRPTPTPRSSVPGPLLVGLVLTTAIVALVIVLIVARKDREARNRYRRRFESEPQFDASEITPTES